MIKVALKENQIGTYNADGTYKAWPARDIYGGHYTRTTATIKRLDAGRFVVIPPNGDSNEIEFVFEGESAIIENGIETPLPQGTMPSQAQLQATPVRPAEVRNEQFDEEFQRELRNRERGGDSPSPSAGNVNTVETQFTDLGNRTSLSSRSSRGSSSIPNRAEPTDAGNG